MLGIVLAEPRHVSDGGAAEPIDRLPSITDDPKLAALAGQSLDQDRAGTIDVLILIDMYPSVLALKLRAKIRVISQAQCREHDKVAIVDMFELFQALLVMAID